jgi:hypothetical protein
MGVDRWPADFRYISRRLVKEIVQQHEATGPRYTKTWSIPLRAIGLSIVRRDPDYLNLFDLTYRATKAVSKRTGSLESPSTYVRAELDIALGYLTVLMGWLDRSHVDIAAMMTIVEVPEAGSVLVGLFGSASNYVWRKPKDDGLGEIPSDVAGLYEILDRTAEDEDPTIDPERVTDEADVIPESRPDTVIRLLSDRFKGFREQRVEILFQVFYRYDNFRYAGARFDRVLIGAPIWVANTETTRDPRRH